MSRTTTHTPRCRWRHWLAASLAASAIGAQAAGFDRILVSAGEGEAAIQAMVWSPCAAAPAPHPIGPFVVQGEPKCPVSGEALPLVVVSHGQGGTLLAHHDTATALADAGCVVVSLNHPGDTFGDEAAAGTLRIFETRPRDVSRVISFMLERWTGRSAGDLRRPEGFGRATFHQRMDAAVLGFFRQHLR